MIATSGSTKSEAREWGTEGGEAIVYYILPHALDANCAFVSVDGRREMLNLI